MVFLVVPVPKPSGIFFLTDLMQSFPVASHNIHGENQSPYLIHTTFTAPAPLSASCLPPSHSTAPTPASNPKNPALPQGLCMCRSPGLEYSSLAPIELPSHCLPASVTNCFIKHLEKIVPCQMAPLTLLHLPPILFLFIALMTWHKMSMS